MDSCSQDHSSQQEEPVHDSSPNCEPSERNLDVPAAQRSAADTGTNLSSSSKYRLVKLLALIDIYVFE